MCICLFKQKSAYEMRISDWSSDVCSSDRRFGDGKSTDYNFFVKAGHDIGTPELYAFGSYGIRDANAAGFYRRSNDSRNRDYGASLTDFVPSYPHGFLQQHTSATGTASCRERVGTYG